MDGDGHDLQDPKRGHHEPEPKLGDLNSPVACLKKYAITYYQRIPLRQRTKTWSLHSGNTWTNQNVRLQLKLPASSPCSRNARRSSCLQTGFLTRVMKRRLQTLAVSVFLDYLG